MRTRNGLGDFRRDPGGGPLVSVIVPTYNYGRFIAQTLENLRQQTYVNWECVVVDDGSTDDTAEVVARSAERDARIKYFRQRNQRQSVAKNTGIANSSGEYVQFLDADDLIEPLKLERQVEFLERSPGVDIVYGGVRYFSTENPDERRHTIYGEDRPWMPEVSGAGREVLLPMMRGNIMVINAPLLRRSVIDDVGPFDPALPPVEDWDYWIRCALAGKRFEFRDFAGAMALVRSHDESSSRQRHPASTATRRLRMKIDSLTADQALRSLSHEAAAQFEADLGIEDIRSRRRLSAAEQFVRAGFSCWRANGRAKWFLCALAAPFLSERQLTGLIKFSPARSLTRLRRGGRAT